MTIVAASDADKATLKKIGETAVLPAWVKRCGARCGEIYNQHATPISGVKYVAN
jgi:hypothetical protein